MPQVVRRELSRGENVYCWAHACDATSRKVSEAASVRVNIARPHRNQLDWTVSGLEAADAMALKASDGQ